MYVVDALMEEDDEGEDAVALTEEQKGSAPSALVNSLVLPLSQNPLHSLP